MPRALFEKTGRAVWMSHLDLMRLFQRAFKRAGLNLMHTQGFSPRAMVSIALPLSVGVESCCEILDYELVDQELSFDEIKDRLNRALPAGVKIFVAPMSYNSQLGVALSLLMIEGDEEVALIEAGI